MSTDKQLAVADIGVGYFSLASFQLSREIATLFAKSSIVPDSFKAVYYDTSKRKMVDQTEQAIANCTMALNMASRLNADPLMVMQNLYIVHGNPSWSAKFLIGCFNSSGRYTSIRYEFEGEPGTDGWGCRAVTTEKSTGTQLAGTLITIGMAKKEGWFSKSQSKWQSMPEHMLRYRAAAWLIRSCAPEIALGITTHEEYEDSIVDMQETSPGKFEVAEVEVSKPAAGKSRLGARIPKVQKEEVQVEVSEPEAEPEPEATVEESVTAEKEDDPFSLAVWIKEAEAKETVKELQDLWMDFRAEASTGFFNDVDEEEFKAACAKRKDEILEMKVE